MRSRTVVVIGVAGENAIQIAFSQNDHVVQTIASDSADDAFDIEILPGGLRRRGNSVGFERKLTAFNDYYNEARVHASLDGNTPTEAGGKSTTRRADTSHNTWQSHSRGLVQLPIAA